MSGAPTIRPRDPRADAATGHRPVALLFPGQGAQHPGMAVGLYQGDADFRARMDEVFALLGPDGAAIRADWLSARPAVALDDLRRAQPLLFAVGWALGRTLLDRGLVPGALLGHSVGEVAAAVLADVLTLPEAVRALRERVAHLAEAPPGGMLAVHASVEAVEAYLDEQVVVGAVNGPRQLLLAGPDGPLTTVERRLRSAGVTCRRARSTAAFHSPLMAVYAARAEPVLRTVRWRPPRLPLYSGYTGQLMTSALATDPGYWASHPVAPVRFGAALDNLLASGPFRLVEAGSPHGLTALARRHPAVAAGRSTAVALLPARPQGPVVDLAARDAVLRDLAAEGHPVALRPPTAEAAAGSRVTGP